MYYFLPKAANRVVYSTDSSIIHFWALIFIYIWAGPHHLCIHRCQIGPNHWVWYFSDADCPSWGGTSSTVFFTLRGVWDNWYEPVLKFMVAAVTAYGYFRGSNALSRVSLPL